MRVDHDKRDKKRNKKYGTSIESITHYYMLDAREGGQSVNMYETH